MAKTDTLDDWKRRALAAEAALATRPQSATLALDDEPADPLDSWEVLDPTTRVSPPKERTITVEIVGPDGTTWSLVTPWVHEGRRPDGKHTTLTAHR